MITRKPLSLLLSFCFAFYLTACQKPSDLNPTSSDSDDTAVHESADDYTWDNADVVAIVLNGSSISVNGKGASVSGSKVTITSAGTYSLSGTLTDGQVIVNTTDRATVRLILNGVMITSSNSAPIYIKDAGKTVISLADNSQNILTDGTTYVYDVPAAEEPNATIFSKSDLSIFGTGSLTVNARFADGIASKDGLIIKSGNMTVNAADDGIRGKDYLIIHDGTLNIMAKADALKSSEDSNTELGYVIINNGTIGISAGDDGIHAETALTINGGKINITKSYEGLEGKNITINDGNIHLVSSDDGVNAAGGTGTGGGMMGSASSSLYKLNINGGYLYVDANGDGLDANGSITMTGGTVLVNGPTATNNGALDYDASFQISGGLLLAAGSSGMPQAPGTTSTQNSVLVGLTAAQQATTLVHIRSSDGKELLTFRPSKRYQSVAFSSPNLTKGTTYDFYYGGSTTGTGSDGLYLDGVYTAGTKYTSFTVSTAVTKVNSR